MEVALVHGRGGEGWTMPLPGGAVTYHDDLAAAVTSIEAEARRRTGSGDTAADAGAGITVGTDAAARGPSDALRPEAAETAAARFDFGHRQSVGPRWVLADTAHD